MGLLSSPLGLGRRAEAVEAVAAPPESAFNFFYERAIASYRAGRYAAAIEDLLIAYKLQPEPRLLFNIAQSQRKLGDAAKARQFFSQYLAEDKEISAEKRAEIERALGELDAELATSRARAAHVAPPQASPTPPAPSALPTSPSPTTQPAASAPEQRAYPVPRWQKALGSLLIIGGAGVLIPGVTFLALDGRCTQPPVAPAVECGRVYDLLLPGAAQTAVGSSLLVAGVLTLVIPYARAARLQSSSLKKDPPAR